MSRPLSQIARECRTDMQEQGSKSKAAGYDWRRKFYAAMPYLGAMLDLHSINDSYGQDTAKSVVRYFLCSVATWKGPRAKALKAELKELLGDR